MATAFPCSDVVQYQQLLPEKRMTINQDNRKASTGKAMALAWQHAVAMQVLVEITHQWASKQKLAIVQQSN